jgi:hypothetical protein
MNTQKNKGDILAETVEKIMSALAAAITEYRAPWTLGRSVNGFTLGEGQEWHRNDWTEDMLPEGWRPHLLGEPDYDGEAITTIGIIKLQYNKYATSANDAHRRTRRPLPEVKKPVPLGPEDVPPGSYVRYIGKPFWTAIESISRGGIVLRTGFYSYEKIKDELEISRDGGKTWEACSK